ncbi:MAG TPA: hypothetical protein PLV45_14630, partial [bacterium]|nr:hypothetical protein [bacterium]
PEAVEEGVTGLLAPVEDPRGLADCIDAFLKDSNMRRAFGAAGRRRVESLFTIDQTVTRTAAMYRSLCDG